MGGDRGVHLLGAGLAASWLAACVIADLATPPSLVALAPLFALAPLVACAVLSTRVTAVFAALALVAAVASGLWNHTWETAQQLVRIVDVALVSASAVAIAAVRIARERRHARVVAIAEVAQRAVLPKVPSLAGSVAAGARYQSAAVDAVVGGDVYDCYLSATHVRFFIGDVRGKGIAAVEQAARTTRAFRQAAAVQPDLPGVAEEMSSYLAQFFDDEEFVTGLLVDATDPGHLVLVGCGHPPALLVTRDGSASLLDAPVGLPLGLGERYEALRVPWAPGDRLLMYTDGLSEARDSRGEFLGVPTLAPILRQGVLDEALDDVVRVVREHVPQGSLTDDLAVVLLENVGDRHVHEPLPPRSPLLERAAGSHGTQMTR